MRGSISPANPWDVMVDLFFYREPEEVKDEAEADDGAPYEPPTYGGAGGLPAPQSACPGIAQLPCDGLAARLWAKLPITAA